MTFKAFLAIGLLYHHTSSRYILEGHVPCAITSRMPWYRLLICLVRSWYLGYLVSARAAPLSQRVKWLCLHVLEHVGLETISSIKLFVLLLKSRICDPTLLWVKQYKVVLIAPQNFLFLLIIHSLRWPYARLFHGPNQHYGIY